MLNDVQVVKEHDQRSGTGQADQGVEPKKPSRFSGIFWTMILVFSCAWSGWTVRGAMDERLIRKLTSVNDQCIGALSGFLAAKRLYRPTQAPEVDKKNLDI